MQIYKNIRYFAKFRINVATSSDIRYFTLVNDPLKIANLGYCKAMAKGGILPPKF